MRTIGVAVGKFNPPHVGHLHLLLAAAAQVDDLYVVLADRPDQTIPAADRAGWLIEDLPDNVTILVTPDDLPPANEPWAERALEILPESPTVAFTSEPWGPGWAAAMGARHLSVDTERRTFPISASTIRSNLRAGFEWLIPAARASLARRVAIVGAESTGKTTLARALAHHYGTVWIPEYGRSYWEGRSHLVNQTWTTEEFRRIATTHHRVEADLACRAVQALVILDTDALVTVVWHRRYLGMDDGPLTDSADRQRPDLYLVCAPDFEWVQDGTRESGTQRADMHRRTLSLVEASGTPFLIVTGDPEARLEQAVRLIDPLITFPPLV